MAQEKETNSSLCEARYSDGGLGDGCGWKTIFSFIFGVTAQRDRSSELYIPAMVRGLFVCQYYSTSGVICRNGNSNSILNSWLVINFSTRLHGDFLEVHKERPTGSSAPLPNSALFDASSAAFLSFSMRIPSSTGFSMFSIATPTFTVWSFWARKASWFRRRASSRGCNLTSAERVYVSFRV